MAKDKVKISNNQVDLNAPLFANPGDPISQTIDPRELRYLGNAVKKGFLFAGTPGSGDGGDDPGDPGPDPRSKYLPQLSDISIVSETFDTTTTPVTIKLKLKIKDSTGEVIKGIRVRVPK